MALLRLVYNVRFVSGKLAAIRPGAGKIAAHAMTVAIVNENIVCFNILFI